MSTASTDVVEGLRAPIAESWHRAQLAGLEPDSALAGMDYGDVDTEGSLLRAARPVLDDLTARLADTTYSTLLVDCAGRLLHRSSDHPGVLRALDALGVDVGASLQEERVGTNAPGTVIETRRSLTVNGDEHFARELRGYSCYAHPIFHPGTRRIVGALDLTARVAEANPLLPPLVARAVADIEERLLSGGRRSHARLLRAFDAVAARRRAVVAVGPDLTMSNQAAMDLLDSADVARLRRLVVDGGAPAGGEACHAVTLASGLRVHVRATSVDGDRGNALLDIEVSPRARPVRRARADRRTSRAASVGPVAAGPRLVCGPAGSGRTTRARALAGGGPVTELTAAHALVAGSASWARCLAHALDAGGGTVVVDGVDLLPDELLDLLATHLATSAAAALVLVSGPREDLTGRAAALAATCVDPVVTLPLAERLHDLGALSAAMLRELGCDPSVHLVPGTLRALSSHPWPGNLRELRAVMAHVASRRTRGAAVLDDLPRGYRTVAPTASLSPIDRAERDAICSALRTHDGNKVRAAESLGISRTTLYAKLRALHITGD